MLAKYNSNNFFTERLNSLNDIDLRSKASAEVQVNQMKVQNIHSRACSSHYSPIDTGYRYVAKFIILKNFISHSSLAN